MEITFRTLMTLIHGLLFGGFYLMALYSLCAEIFFGGERLLKPGYLIVMVLAGWFAIFLGAYLVYPWYRAAAPAGVLNLNPYPQALLLSSTQTAGWHKIGMEWKEQIAWISVILATTASYLFIRYKDFLKTLPQICNIALMFLLIALLSGGVAGLFGVMLNKFAPVTGGRVIHLTGGTSEH